MEKRSPVINYIQYILLSAVFLVPLFSLDYLAYSAVEKALLFFLLVEVAFFFWLYVILNSKSYLPPRNTLFIIGGMFLVFYTLAGVLAMSPELAFWSTMSRMTGLILLFHVAALILMLVSVFKEDGSWRRMMGTIAISGVLVALPSYLTIVTSEKVYLKSTFGNDSYVAAYLTFAFFFSLILYVKSYKRAFALCAAVIIFSPIFLSLKDLPSILTDPTSILGSARAAAVSIFVGLALSALIYTSSILKPKLALLTRIASGVFFVLLLILSVLVSVPDTIVQNKVADFDFGSRLVFWESAIEGVKEKPLLGYGPENYFVPFYKHFNPALLTGDYGYETFTSKPHSAYIEVLVSGGILSFIFYLALWLAAFVLLWRIWLRGILPPQELALLAGLLSAYLLQNIVLFDTLSTYMGIGILLAYLIYLSSTNMGSYPPISRVVSWPKVATISILALVTIYFLVISPLQQQMKLIHVLEEVTVQERVGLYEDLFSTSPGLRLSMSEYLMAKAYMSIPSALNNTTSKENQIILSDLDSLRSTTIKYFEDTDLVHYRHALYLAKLHLLQWVLEDEKDKKEELLVSVQKIELILEELSPGNPQNYWIQAQRELFAGNTPRALEILKNTDNQTPDILSTKEKINSVEMYLQGEGNVPFFTD